MKIQNNILKKQGNSNITLPPNKLKVTISSQNLNNTTNDSVAQITNKTSKTLINKNKTSSQSTVNNKSRLLQGEPSNSQQTKNTKKCNTVLSSTEKDLKSEQSKQKSIKPHPKKSNISQTYKQAKPSTVEVFENNKDEQNQPSEVTDQLSTLSISTEQNDPESNTIMDETQTVNNVNQNQSCVMTLLKSPPNLSELLIKFLSKDLIKKSLEVCYIKYVNFSIIFCLNRNILIK